MNSFAHAPRTMREFQPTCVVLEKGVYNKGIGSIGLNFSGSLFELFGAQLPFQFA